MNNKSSNIAVWLHDSAAKLREVGIVSAYLDAEIILAHTLRKNRTWLHAHDHEDIVPRRLEIANARLEMRLDRVPIAYIIGHKEFYGRRFHVSPSVLIPRPESETIIELLRELYRPCHKKLVDVGSGSGVLGITAKLELPELSVTLCDISHHALTVASNNVAEYKTDVQLIESNLLDSYPLIADIIIANLPYVDETWERSPETNHEPGIALFAKQDGLDLIYKLIDQTSEKLSSGGILILEADPVQHDAIIKYSKSRGLSPSKLKDYILALIKD